MGVVTFLFTHGAAMYCFVGDPYMVLFAWQQPLQQPQVLFHKGPNFLPTTFGVRNVISPFSTSPKKIALFQLPKPVKGKTPLFNMYRWSHGTDHCSPRRRLIYGASLTTIHPKKNTFTTPQ